MPKAEWIARQSGHPRGWVGTWVARIMALDTRRINESAILAFAPKRGEHVLEVGCGHGRTLRRIAATTPVACATGIDPSTVMLREARRRNAGAIRSGRVRVEEGEAAVLPFESAHFHAALSVHTIYFWPDLSAGLREVRRVLRGGGRLLLVHHPAEDAARSAELPATIYTLRAIPELEKALGEAGFEAVHTERAPGADAGPVFTHARAAVTGPP